jgi:hypothetical protein
MGLVKELRMLRSVDLSDYMVHKPFKVAISDNIFVAIDIIIENKFRVFALLMMRVLWLVFCRRWIV